MNTTVPQPLATSHQHLPPSPRDLEIHRLNAVEFLSTYRIAENFKLSQTRVRQIIARVNDWLAEVLPAPTEADIEKQKRLALHLAAAQLRHQIETLATYWSATGDPKYLRQQTRAILALARLGTPATTLDAIAASLEDDADPTPTQARRASQGNPPSTPTNSNPATTPTHSEIANPQSAITPPPPGDCSPTTESAPEPTAALPADQDTTSFPVNDFDPNWFYQPDTIAGLELMEKRLLTLLDDTLHSDTNRRQSLTETLTTIRREKAEVILKLTPNIQGASLTPTTP